MEIEVVKPNLVSVELEVDNEGGRIPVADETLRIKREFSSENGRDQFYLNDKHIVRAELENLFAFTGLHSSNDY